MLALLANMINLIYPGVSHSEVFPSKQGAHLDYRFAASHVTGTPLLELFSELINSIIAKILKATQRADIRNEEVKNSLLYGH